MPRDMRRRLSRILLNAASRMSLVSCVVLIAACAVSYVVAGGFWYTPHGGRWRMEAESAGGLVRLRVSDYYNFDAPSFAQNPDPAWDRGERWHYFAPGPLESSAGWLGVRVDAERVAFSPRRRGKIIRTIGWFKSRGVVVAYWPLVILTGLLPLTQFVRRRRAKRPAGHCVACGYDLRATPDRCPECGTSPAAGPSA
jgi:hypothetical protein